MPQNAEHGADVETFLKVSTSLGSMVHGAERTARTLVLRATRSTAKPFQRDGKGFAVGLAPHSLDGETFSESPKGFAVALIGAQIVGKEGGTDSRSRSPTNSTHGVQVVIRSA